MILKTNFLNRIIGVEQSKQKFLTLSLLNTKLCGWNNMMGYLPGDIINDFVCPWDIEHDPEVESGRVPWL